MNLAVYPGAAALLDGNLNVSVILRGIKKITPVIPPKYCQQEETIIRGLAVKPTDLSAVTEEQHSGVCGVDVDCLQLNQVV